MMNTVRRSMLTTAVALALGLGAGGTMARAEVDEIKLVQQFGIGYLPLVVMKHDKLIEKNLVTAGLKDTKVTWSVLGAGMAANDAILAGNLHVASGGAPPFLTLWDRTRGNVDVKAIGALCNMPNYLNTRNPSVKTIKDFTDKDRISIAGAGNSAQTLYLQMEVAKIWGIENFKKLNPLLVNLPHPDGMTALLSGGGEVTAHFTSPPFLNQELKRPGITRVLNSYDVLGGPSTFLLAWTSSKFRNENPKSFKAIFDALNEAMARINADKSRAAEIYVADSKGKEKHDEILAMLNEPENTYGIAPAKMVKMAEFMHQVGYLKAKPAGWKDLFFPETHHLQGD